MDVVVVVGAGLSGVACAREIQAAGLPVRLVDRGRRVGGRMASRRIEGRYVDLGASYLTAEHDDFRAVVADWERRGLAVPWTDTLDVRDASGVARSTTGPVRWGAPGGLRSLVEDLAVDLEIELATHLDTMPGGDVVLAMPDVQAARLVGDDPAWQAVRRHLDRAYEPVLALAAWWDRRAWDLDGVFVNDHEVISWIADDGRRRGDGAPVLVAHSTAGFAEPHLLDPRAATDPMVAALCEVLDLEPPTGTYLHRWSVARPTDTRAETYLLTTRPDGGLVGVCGDGWGPTSKVETAWLSGRALGREISRRLSASA